MSIDLGGPPIALDVILAQHQHTKDRYLSSIFFVFGIDLSTAAALVLCGHPVAKRSWRLCHARA